MDFAAEAKHRVKMEKKKNWKDRRGLEYCQRTEKVVEHEPDGDTNCSKCTWNGLQKPGKKNGGTGDQKNNRDYPDHITLEINKNSLKSLGELWRLAVTQTSVST